MKWLDEEHKDLRERFSMVVEQMEGKVSEEWFIMAHCGLDVEPTNEDDYWEHMEAHGTQLIHPISKTIPSLVERIEKHMDLHKSLEWAKGEVIELGASRLGKKDATPHVQV